MTAVSRALDAVAQFVEPLEGGAVGIRADDDTVEFVRAVVGLAAAYAHLSSPTLPASDIADALRLSAHLIREVESSVGD